MVSQPGRGAVLHYMAEWLPASEVFVHDLVRHLARPAVVVSALPLTNTERFDVAHAHSLWPIERYLHPQSWRPRAEDAVFRFLERRHHVELVHAHHGYRLQKLVASLRRHSMPFVLSLHGHDVTGYLESYPDAYDEVRQRADAVVVPSRFAVDLAVEAGFPAGRIHVLPSGIDTTFFAATPLPPGPPEVLFVGRFVAKKGLDVLARAWPAVQAAVPDAGLRLLGFGPLEELARSIPGSVRIETSPDRHAVRRAMQRCTVVVSPSHEAPDDAVETLLVVNLEAQACGRPVVTTRHGGIPEYVRPGHTALVVEEGDADALADALVTVLSDRALAERLAANGPGAVAHLDVRRTAARMDDLYEGLLSGASERRPTG